MKYVTCAAFDVSKMASLVKEIRVQRVGIGVEVLKSSPMAARDHPVVIVKLLDGRDAVRQAMVVKCVDLALEVALTWNERTGDAVLIVDVVCATID